MHTKACSQGPRCRSAARALGAWLPEAQIQQQMVILARKPSKSKREEKTFPCLLQTGEGFSSRLDRQAFGMNLDMRFLPNDSQDLSASPGNKS